MKAESQEWDLPKATHPPPATIPVRSGVRWIGLPCLALGFFLGVLSVSAIFQSPVPDSFPEWLALPVVLLPALIGFSFAATGFQLLRTPSFGSLKTNLGILAFLLLFFPIVRLTEGTGGPGLFIIPIGACAPYLIFAFRWGHRLLDAPAPPLGAWISRGMVALISVVLWLDLNQLLINHEPRGSSPGADLLFTVVFLIPIAVAIAFFQIATRLLGLKRHPHR